MGRQVIVKGTMATDSNGERYVYANGLNVVSPEIIPIQPLGMPNETIGGGDLSVDPLGSAGQRGSYGMTGLNNVGLLVPTWGQGSDPCRIGRLLADRQRPSRA